MNIQQNLIAGVLTILPLAAVWFVLKLIFDALSYFGSPWAMWTAQQLGPYLPTSLAAILGSSIFLYLIGTAFALFVLYLVGALATQRERIDDLHRDVRAADGDVMHRAFAMMREGELRSVFEPQRMNEAAGLHVLREEAVEARLLHAEFEVVGDRFHELLCLVVLSRECLDDGNRSDFFGQNRNHLLPAFAQFDTDLTDAGKQ